MIRSNRNNRLTPSYRRALQRLSKDVILVKHGASFGRNGDAPLDRVPHNVARGLYSMGLAIFQQFGGVTLFMLSDRGWRDAPKWLRGT